MKVKLTFLIFCISYISVNAQKVELNLFASPLATYGFSPRTTSYFALGYGAGISSFYKLSEKTAIGVVAKYSMLKYSFLSDGFYDVKIDMQTLSILPKAQFLLNNNWYFGAGAGFSYIMQSTTQINYSIIRNGNKIIKQINDNEIDELDENYYAYLHFSLGRNFDIANRQLFLELFAEQAFTRNKILHGGGFNDRLYAQVFLPNHLGLNIGIKL